MAQVTFFNRHPYLASLLLFSTTLIIFFISGTVVTVLELPIMTLYVVAFLVLGMLCIALLVIKNWWRQVGFRRPYQRKLLWLFWLPFLPVFGNLLDGITVVDPAHVLMFATIALLSGFVEETFFRG